MFEGRYSIAVNPEGEIVLPPALRKEMHLRMGPSPALMGFGVQFLYICGEDGAEELLVQLNAQLCAAFSGDKRQATAYFKQMGPSVTKLFPSDSGRIKLSRAMLELLEYRQGDLLTVMGVGDHLEIWNRARWQARLRALERSMLNKSEPAQHSLLETPICLQRGESCSLLRNGRPQPKLCGPCVHLRLP
ncbi:MAG: division/cell wall cluster transcriptional repressor MraZ [Oscillospiraceae bacterium]|nr:division/cell wall cluster transcriptional repressor MraZ [Oscillospiraceae bacterium]